MKKIGIIPLYRNQTKNKMFTIEEDNIHQKLSIPYVKLRKIFMERNVAFDTMDLIDRKEKCDYYIFYRLDWSLIFRLFLLRKLEKAIYIQLEPPAVTEYHGIKGMRLLQNIFGKIITWNDDLVDNKKFFKYNIPMYTGNEKNFIKSFDTKKMICNISGNKWSINKDELYSEREKMIRFFEENYPNEFDLYGIGWEKEKYPSYRGKIMDKMRTLGNYKFSLCYENQKNINGYITEKIFECFYGGVIPVYWGANNIEKYVPSDCFIDRRKFKSNEELYFYLQNMSEQEYDKKIKKIDEFLSSEHYKKFLEKEFSEKIYDIIMNKPTLKVNYTKAFISSIIFSFLRRGHKIMRSIEKNKREKKNG